MEQFWARMGFGCGRLRGGAEESNSRRLLDAAIDCGFRYFDTAPAYGSEELLGSALRGIRAHVEICTKVGLARSAVAPAVTFRGVLLTAIRATVPEVLLATVKRARARRTVPATPSAQRGYGIFSADSIRSSFRQSLELLQTDRVDCLMLHEPGPADPSPEVELVLREFVGAGATGRLGVGTGFSLEHLPVFGDVAQFAIGRRPPPPEDGRILNAHGLLRGFDAVRFERLMLESNVAESTPWLQRGMRSPLQASALLLNVVLISRTYSRIIISTSSVANLRNFMAAATAMFEELQPLLDDAMRSNFAVVLEQYLGGANHAT